MMISFLQSLVSNGSQLLQATMWIKKPPISERKLRDFCQEGVLVVLAVCLTRNAMMIAFVTKVFLFSLPKATKPCLINERRLPRPLMNAPPLSARAKVRDKISDWSKLWAPQVRNWQLKLTVSGENGALVRRPFRPPWAQNQQIEGAWIAKMRPCSTTQGAEQGCRFEQKLRTFWSLFCAQNGCP